MIPITRKELYLNKIVGNNNYEAPEKPITTEEFFFAEILGEAVQAPEPLTRYQMYLAKIAGREIEIPYPEVRLEYFLARAAGMEIETPTPITREEIFWSNYSAIVDFEVEGVPPLTYKAVAGALKDYRIYGNTENGESVGNRTENILNELPQNITNKGITFTNYDNKYIRITGISSDVYAQTDAAIIYLEAGTYSIRFFSKNSEFNTNIFVLLRHLDNTNIITINVNGGTFTLNNGETIRFITGVIQNNVEINTDVYYMVIKQSQIPDEYEPYGYKIPITNNSETANIYLDAPLRKVGDEAEYVDYAEQKWRRVRKNLLQNTATSQTKRGITFTVNTDGSITCSGILTSGEYADLVISGVFLGDIDILENGNYIVSCANGSNNTSLIIGNSKGEVGRMRVAEINISANLTWAILRIYQANPAITLYPMIRKADIEDDTYEPYIENSEVDVTLPALPAQSSTNSLSVGTAVQPSKVYIKGKKERE